MFVAIHKDVSDGFRAWLQALIEAGPGSVNALALAAEVDQSQLSKVVRGAERATDAVLAKIAPRLGLTPEQLVLLAAADRIGGKEAFSASVAVVAARLAEFPSGELAAKSNLPEAFTKRLKARQDQQDAETAKQQEKLEQEVRDGARWEIPAAAGDGVLLVDPDHREHSQVDPPFSEDA